MLSVKHNEIIDRHFSLSHLHGDKGVTRVPQWGQFSSVHNPRTGRLHVHKNDRRKSAEQQLVFESVTSISSTITQHGVKLWDLRRQLSHRELLRLQGFPEWFCIPSSHAKELTANAVCVPVAAFACSRLPFASDHQIKFLDVCAGIGGFNCAVLAQFPYATCVGASEIKASATQSYRENFPTVPLLGDARCATWPAADLVCAGFPCQPFSRSQQTYAMHNHPAVLFFKSVIKCVHDSGATAVVLENVSSLLTTGGDIFNALLFDLTTLGFHVTHQVLDAKEFGIPQTRKRVYIIASKNIPPPAPLSRVPPHCHLLDNVLDLDAILHDGGVFLQVRVFEKRDTRLLVLLLTVFILRQFFDQLCPHFATFVNANVHGGIGFLQHLLDHIGHIAHWNAMYR